MNRSFGAFSSSALFHKPDTTSTSVAGMTRSSSSRVRTSMLLMLVPRAANRLCSWYATWAKQIVRPSLGSMTVLLRPGTGRADHRAPTLALADQERAHFLGRSFHRIGAHVLQPLGGVRLAESF